MKITQLIPRALTSFLFAVGLFMAPGFAASAMAKTYYVDNRLSSDCTSGNYSIAKRACGGSDGAAWNTIQEAVTKLSPGDTILVRGGTYRERVIIRNGNSGTASAYKTIKAYNGENVVWDGNSSAGTADGPLALHNVSFWQIGEMGAGFTFTDDQANYCLRATTYSDNHKVTCEGQSGVGLCGIKVIGNTFKDCGARTTGDRIALAVVTTDGNISRGHLIKGNTVRDFARHAISVRKSTHTIVEDNVIDNQGSTKYYVANGQDPNWVGIACTSFARFITIRRNTVRNLVDTTKGANPNGIWTDWGCSDTLISHNTVFNIRGGNKRVHNGRGIFNEQAVKRNEISNNLVYKVGTGYAGPGKALRPEEDTIIENNMFVNNTNYGICLDNSKRVIVRNNVLTGNGIGALMVVRPHSHAVGTPLTGKDKPIFQNNTWPMDTGKIANLTYQDGKYPSSCYEAPDRSVAELARVATSESTREGVGEQGTLARREAPLSDSDLAKLSPPSSSTILASPGGLQLVNN